MTRVTHTHRGHCQYCLRVHAIDTVTGRLAKHGYTVEGGMFSGSCPGSEELSLHVERSATDEVIKRYQKTIKNCEQRIALLVSDEVKPTEAWSGKYETRTETNRRGSYINRHAWKMVPFADAPKEHQEYAVRKEINTYENTAHNAKRISDQMIEWAAKIYDAKRPAYPNEDFDNGEWKVGDTVRIGGKGSKGYNATIEAIEDQEMTTRGFRRGTQTIVVPHARITRPAVEEKRSKDGWSTIREGRAAKVIWEPLRNIKRQANELVSELKKAGLV